MHGIFCPDSYSNSVKVGKIVNLGLVWALLPCLVKTKLFEHSFIQWVRTLKFHECESSVKNKDITRKEKEKRKKTEKCDIWLENIEIEKIVK